MDPGLCPGALCSSACAVGFPLPATQLPPWRRCPSPSELVPEPHSPLRRDPLPLLEPTPSPGLTAPSMWSHHPSPSKLLRVQLWALQSFRELDVGYGAVSWARRCLLVFQGARGHPRHLGVLLQLPAGAFPPGKIGEAPASLGQSFLILEALVQALAQNLVGPLPLGCLLFLFF